MAALLGMLAGSGLMFVVQLLLMRHDARKWAEMVERHEKRLKEAK